MYILFLYLLFTIVLPPPPSLSLSNLEVKAMVININIIRIIDMDEPKCQSPVHLNCCSIRLPIKLYLLPPSNEEIIKVLTAGIKTMVIPVMIPGMLNGKITLKNSCLIGTQVFSSLY